MYRIFTVLETISSYQVIFGLNGFNLIGPRIQMCNLYPRIKSYKPPARLVKLANICVCASYDSRLSSYYSITAAIIALEPGWTRLINWGSDHYYITIDKSWSSSWLTPAFVVQCIHKTHPKRQLRLLSFGYLVLT